MKSGEGRLTSEESEGSHQHLDIIVKQNHQIQSLDDSRYTSDALISGIYTYRILFLLFRQEKQDQINCVEEGEGEKYNGDSS